MRKKPYVIGISGGSGSGKTFFLNCFLKHFKSDDIAVLSQDNYYVRVPNLSPEENKVYNFDLPCRIDDTTLLEDLQKVLNGETIYKKEYTFNHSDTSATQLLEIKSAPIIVLEGIFVFHFPHIAALIDLKIFIDAEEHIALERRIKRDIEERNYTLDNVLYKWVNCVLPGYKKYLLPHKHTADKIVSNNTNIVADMVRVTEQISQTVKEKVLRIVS